MDTVVNVYTKKETKLKPKMNGKYQIPDDWIPDIVYYLASDDKNRIPYHAGNLKYRVFQETLKRHFITLVETSHFYQMNFSFEIAKDGNHLNIITDEYDYAAYLVIKYLVFPHIPETIIPAKRDALEYAEMQTFFKLLIDVVRSEADESELASYLESIDFDSYLLDF